MTHKSQVDSPVATIDSLADTGLTSELTPQLAPDTSVTDIGLTNHDWIDKLTLDSSLNDFDNGVKF